MKKISKNTTKEIECKSKVKNNSMRVVFLVVTLIFMTSFLVISFSLSSKSSYAADLTSTGNSGSSSASTINISKEYAYSLISQINSNITNIKSQGYKTDRFEDGLAEMQTAYDKLDYYSTYVKYIETNDLISKFYYLNDIINKIDLFIQEMNRRELNKNSIEYIISGQKSDENQTKEQTTGNSQAINITQITFDFELGKNYFDNNNYEQAESTLVRIYNTINSFLFNEAQQEIVILRAISSDLESKNLSKSAIDGTITKLQISMQTRDFNQLFLISMNMQKINASVIDLEELKNNISFLEEKNYKTSRIKDDFYELQTLFEQEKYDEFMTKYDETQATISQIFTVTEKIDQTKKKLDEKKLTGIDFSDGEYYLNLSIEEFNNENYAKTEEYLTKANELIDEIESKHIFASMMGKARIKFHLLTFLKNNHLMIIIVLISGSIVGFLSYHFISIKILQIKLNGLNKEQETVLNLIKKAQMDYFKNKSIDSETYKATYDELQNRFAENKRNIPGIKSNLAKKQNLLRKIRFKK